MRSCCVVQNESTGLKSKRFTATLQAVFQHLRSDSKIMKTRMTASNTNLTAASAQPLTAASLRVPDHMSLNASHERLQEGFAQSPQETFAGAQLSIVLKAPYRMINSAVKKALGTLLRETVKHLADRRKEKASPMKLSITKQVPAECGSAEFCMKSIKHVTRHLSCPPLQRHITRPPNMFN